MWETVVDETTHDEMPVDETSLEMPRETDTPSTIKPARKKNRRNAGDAQLRRAATLALTLETLTEREREVVSLAQGANETDVVSLAALMTARDTASIVLADTAVLVRSNAYDQLVYLLGMEKERLADVGKLCKNLGLLKTVSTDERTLMTSVAESLGSLPSETVADITHVSEVLAS